jgi:hypothetical protein
VLQIGKAKDLSAALRTIKIDLREIEWVAMNWIHLAYDRDQWTAPVNTAMEFP